MEITWHGHAHFRLRGREGTVVTDPTFRSGGGASGRMAIDVVTVSHAHPAHCQVAQLGGEPMVLTGPGEYEVKGIVITGIQTFHDAERGRKRGKNTVFRIELDDLVVCHLGDLGHVLTSDQIDQIGNNVDVLFVPVGGGGTIDASQAIEVISLLDPRLVIPMHYRVNDLDLRLDTVDRFLREMGVTGVEAEPRLTVTRTSLPEETSVVVLQPRPF
ncbi:MAG TPA: MBL fold metallo-hydrolase [Chloroflexota bacterium]|jgi:L-ascorbate metabolism protein UlaG (beta-lactamase superfamily)|nr:MBL fold metallo-hydrolase [Chloroflexota bacterium]